MQKQEEHYPTRPEQHPSALQTVQSVTPGRALVIIGIALLVIFFLVFFWYIAQVFFLIFAGILFAILLCIPAGWLINHTPLSGPWAVVLVLVTAFALLGTGVYFLAPAITSQINQLTQTIPQGIEQINAWLQQAGWMQQLPWNIQRLDDLIPSASNALSRIPRVFTGLMGILTSLLVIFALGVFLSLQPSMYINGFARLFPHHRREHVHDVLVTVGYSLKWWLISRMFSMMVIGTMTAIGLWVLGVPNALVLGIVSGVVNFVPFIGTILALVPVGIVALLQSPLTLLYVLIFYFGVQTVESYFLTPFVQQRAVHIPPALGLSFQLLLSILTGVWGFLLAIPLIAAILVLVKILYIEDVLGDETDVRRPD
ncbi:MAG: AI-2E family transporter [Chloroflexaceae bacterium]|nr:AI-2E family transporter [Chloroflexaceae bacterium]NJO04813.1 AI-2E family transporter [Chloroflexaceae bacterium]